MLGLSRWRKTKDRSSASPQDEGPSEPASLQLVKHSNKAISSISRSEFAQDPPRDHEDTTSPQRSPRDVSQTRTTSTTPKASEQKWGLFLLNPQTFPSDSNEIENTYPIDIVAVHGITGSAYSTWTHKNNAFWLRDFLPAQFPGARVFSYGYPADVFFSKERGDIGTFARTLLVKLNRERDTIESKRRPIIFICHSMGGIVVKQALITAKIESDSYDSILKSVTDILFFATPHRGADNAKLLEMLAAVANIPTRGMRLTPAFRSDLLKALRKESKELKDISTSFRKLIPDLRIVSFIEQMTMSILKDRIVDENTGVMDDPRESIKHMDGCDHTSICRFADDGDESYKDVLHSLRDAASKATNKILDEMKTEDIPCLDSLAFSDMFHRNSDADRAAPNTCRWIFRHPAYTTWMNQSRGLLWVKGKPGSGKSTLMAFIFLAFQILPAQRTQINLSFFFHGRGTTLQKSAEGMFRSLLQQLYKLSISSRRIILRAFKEKKGFGGAGRDWEWRVKELQELFSKAVREVAQWREVTIFVDALDEAGSETAAELVNYFHQLNDAVASDQGSSAKISISCRHYPVVARNPGLEILVEEQNYRDIWTFVHGRLEKEVPPRPEDVSFLLRQKELGDAIVKKAGDSFQWASIMMPKVIEALKDGESFEDINEQVAEESNELFVFYENILRNVIKPRNRTRTLLLLQWVCFAQKPLSVTELRMALACDDEVIRPDQTRCEDSKGFVESDGRMKMLVNSLSGGLVETRQYESRTVVQVCHQTINDFLLSGGLQFMLSPSTGPTLDADYVIGRSENRLVRCCINYLSLGKVLEEDRTWSKDVVDSLPFIEYATKYWFLHAEKAESAGSSQEILIKDFSAKQDLFMMWADIYEAIDRHGSRCPEPGSALIHVASASNLRTVVRALLDNGTSVESETDFKSRPLHYAARWGHAELVALLLDANADREAKNRSGGTPLERATANHHEDVMKMLLTRGVDVNERTGYSGTALQSACMKGSTSLVRMLIDHGADINAQAGENGNALQAAAFNGNEAVVRLLLDEGAQVNAIGGYSGTALQAATLCRPESSETIVKILLASGAQVNLRGGRYDNALQGAATRTDDNATNLVRILLECGAEVNFSGGEYGSALQAAAVSGNELVVDMLLNAGVDVNLKEGVYGYALQAAAVGGHEKIVGVLLDKGSNINAVGGSHGTALHGAAFSGNKALIEMLLDHGADLNADVEDCGSVLQAAAYQCSESVIHLLIERGAKLNTRSGEQGNVLQAAANWGRNERILQLLLSYGADVNAESSCYYNTALQAACAQGKVANVKFLLDNGADPSIRAGWFGNALQLAVKFRHEEVARLLLERGANINAKGGLYNSVFEAANVNRAMTRLLADFGTSP